MVTLTAHFDGKVIVPDEPLALKANQKVRIIVEPIPSPPAAETTPRRFGLQRGAVVYMSPDFNDHLGDAFWLGEEK